jgi:hypothetical protein
MKPVKKEIRMSKKRYSLCLDENMFVELVTYLPAMAIIDQAAIKNCTSGMSKEAQNAIGT